MADAANRLASEHRHETTKGALTALLGLVVAIVLGVNALAVRLSPAAERTYDGRTVAVKWDVASAGAPDGGIVVVGDSSGNFAVSTSVLEAELGRPSRNLCTYGRFLVTGSGWFLDRAIESGDGTPSLALVVLGSRTFVMEPSGFSFAQVPIAFGDWSSRAPRVPLSFVEAGQFAVARVLPLFAQHKSFERGLRRDMWTIDTSLLPIEPDGTSVLTRAWPDGVAPFAEKVVGELTSFEGPVPSERDRAALAGLVRDAEERGYDIVFVDGPVWSGLASREEHSAFLARVHEHLDELCETSDRAWHLPGGLQTFEPSELENPFHLVGAAPGRFTTELARRLRALGLPR